jgi:hypothetical protein
VRRAPRSMSEEPEENSGPIDHHLNGQRLERSPQPRAKGKS